MHPSDPSDRYTSLPSPGRCSCTSNAASDVRTVDWSRCHVSSRGRDRGIVGRLGEEIQVERGRVGVELVGRAGRDADRPAKLVVLGEQLCVDAAVLVAERLPLRAVADRQSRERRRKQRVAHLERVGRHEPRPGTAGDLDRREARDVVGADQVGPDVVPDLHQPVMGVAGARHERLPDRLRDRLLLLDGRPPELGRRHPDELGPGIGRRIGGLLGGRHPHLALLEPARFENSAERLVDHEHDAMAALPQHVAQSDAVVGRPPRSRLREEHDGLAAGGRHGRRECISRRRGPPRRIPRAPPRARLRTRTPDFGSIHKVDFQVAPGRPRAHIRTRGEDR